MAQQNEHRTISFESLVIGEQYDRPYLAELWGFKDWHAIGRGAVTPRGENKIILFITHEQQESLTQYQDHFEGDRLFIEGETNHAADNRIINASGSGDEVYLFYRDRHHMAFTYYGEVKLDKFERNTERPSRFVFHTQRYEGLANSALLTEGATHGVDPTSWTPDPEGGATTYTGIRYERSRKNRAKALQIHGTRCLCCGFDFNAVYGIELARDFIEVHHVQSVAVPNAKPDPEKDLTPVCSNCHSMLHRRQGRPMEVDELRKIITRNRGNQSP